MGAACRGRAAIATRSSSRRPPPGSRRCSRSRSRRDRTRPFPRRRSTPRSLPSRSEVRPFRLVWSPRMAGAASKRKSSAGNGGYTPEVTRRALVESAIKLFGEKSYAATSVQEITEAAGVTKGAFYHHFETKEDLLALIHDEFADLYLAVLERVIEENEDPVDQLVELLRAFVPMVERY